MLTSVDLTPFPSPFPPPSPSPLPLPPLKQANSEVSALLGRIPSAVGYQPTLATDLGQLQERITTTKKGSITSVQVRTRRAACRGVLRFSISLLDCGGRGARKG